MTDRIEDLQPAQTRPGYQMRWQEAGVQASLVPVASASSTGFFLEISSNQEPDPMSQGQPRRADTLLSSIQTHMRETLIAAGWLVVGRLGHPPREVWQHQDRLWGQRSVQERQELAAQLANLGQGPTSGQVTGNQPISPVVQESNQPASRVVEVYGDKEARERAKSLGAPPAYRRLVKDVLHTFSCVRCGSQTQLSRYPGAKPHYCESCLLIVRREQTRMRVQKLREKRRAQQAALENSGASTRSSF